LKGNVKSVWKQSLLLSFTTALEVASNAAVSNASLELKNGITLIQSIEKIALSMKEIVIIMILKP
jgi:hypothetical protein